MSLPMPAPAPQEAALDDLRFRALLGPQGWARLAPAVRTRFSRKASDGRTLIFVGRVVETRMTRLGRVAAQLCRAIGGPLPIDRTADVASVVTITEDLRREGQIWTRLYARRRGFPQVIHSSKRFAGPTDLEEHVGGGVGMTLTLAAEHGALVFRSDRYFVELAGRRAYLPGWLTPGRLTVRHTPVDAARFVFSLDIEHPRFGHILHQSAIYEETVP